MDRKNQTVSTRERMSRPPWEIRQDPRNPGMVLVTHNRTAMGKTTEFLEAVRTQMPELQMERAMEPGKNEQRTLTSSTLQRMDGDGNERKFTLSFSSEEPYERWFGLEILDHSPGAVDLQRINDIGCLLFNHNRDAVIGKVNRAWVENNRGYAEVEFDTDAESEIIYQKVKNGTLKGVSVGYRIDSIEEVMAGKTSADGRFTGPCEIARKWWPFEISIVSVPADATVGVGREADHSGKTPMSVYESQLQINQNIIGG